MQGVVRQYHYWRTVPRRTWKLNAISSFLMPALYLLSVAAATGEIGWGLLRGGLLYSATFFPLAAYPGSLQP